jgi:uncharacterized protein YqeY
MAINERLMQDLKTAMREKDTLKKSVITMLRAAIKQMEVDSRQEVTDEMVHEIIAKQIKQKKGAIEDFDKADRQDLVEEARAEIEVLMTYLPEQMSEDEIRELVEQTISDLGASSMKDMGKVMGALVEKTKGRADNGLVSKIVREKLNA